MIAARIAPSPPAAAGGCQQAAGELAWRVLARDLTRPPGLQVAHLTSVRCAPADATIVVLNSLTRWA